WYGYGCQGVGRTLGRCTSNPSSDVEVSAEAGFGRRGVKRRVGVDFCVNRRGQAPSLRPLFARACRVQGDPVGYRCATVFRTGASPGPTMKSCKKSDDHPQGLELWLNGLCEIGVIGQWLCVRWCHNTI